ncbi:MAG TPA: hypothetical protein PLD14_02080 [Candidatus Pacearchaeota archaeon]|nr:hypothetical protein [Candidatus Pacearchaeota archaeon]HPR79989.1 hypothetical protein [Candidatus Pacearchaeota archaeon]
MELFPSVEVKNIGNFRNSVFQLLEEGSRSDAKYIAQTLTNLKIEI